MGYLSQDGIIGAASAFLFLGPVFVALRFSIHRWKNAIGPDDWLSLAALAFVLGYCIAMIIAARQHTMGGHGNPTKSVLDTMLKTTMVTGTLRNPALGLTKLSMLFFYRRIFGKVKSFKLTNRTMTGAVTAWTVAFTVLDIFDCKLPISNLWKHNTECVNAQGYNVAQAAIDVAMDLVLIIMPQPLVWNLQINIRKKLLITFVFAVGMLSIVAAILRLVYRVGFLQLTKTESHKSVAGMTLSDRLQAQSFSWFWLTIELGVSIVATCLPTCGPLIFEYSAVMESLRSMISRGTTTEILPLKRKRSGDSDAAGSDANAASVRQMV